jgi:hypothetical protein
MNDASYPLRTSYDPRRPTVSNSMLFDEASRQAFDSMLSELTKAAVAFGGVDRLSAPRIEAARHEAGHAVIDTALDDEVRSISIFRLPKHEQQFKELGVAAEIWGGATFATKSWACGPHSDPKEDLKFVQHVLGGWIGEWFDDASQMRPASSLDEIVLAKMTCGCVAHKLGKDAATLFVDQIGAVNAILVANKATHAALTARLMRKTSIGPNAIKRLLQNVRRAPSAAID